MQKHNTRDIQSQTNNLPIFLRARLARFFGGEGGVILAFINLNIDFGRIKRTNEIKANVLKNECTCACNIL